MQIMLVCNTPQYRASYFSAAECRCNCTRAANNNAAPPALVHGPHTARVASSAHHIHLASSIAFPSSSSVGGGQLAPVCQLDGFL